MKILKNIGAAGLVLLAGLGGYLLLRGSGLDEKVAEQGARIDKQGTRIGKVEKEAEIHQAKIADNRKDIELLKGEVSEARDQLVEVQGQVKETRGRLGAAEGELKEALESADRNASAIAKLRERVDEATRQQANLKGELDRRALKVQVLAERLKEQERINIDFSRRLRLLEDKAGLKPPIP